VAGVENYTLLGKDAATFGGNALDNRISGTDQSDTLSGAGGDDTLIGNYGLDTLNGGGGDDILDGGYGFDTMSGGSGNDVYYVDQLGDVVIEAKNQGADEIRVDSFFGGTFAAVANVENYTFTGFQVIEFTGTKDNNRIVGDQGTYTFSGGDGNDTIIGGSGHGSTLNGDAGNDKLYAGAGGTFMHGGDGDDLLSGSDGGLDGYGDAGNDTIIGGAFHDTLYGGTGNDYLDGGGDSDYLEGGDGDDTLLGGDGSDILTGGAGNDLLLGGPGDDDSLDGGIGDDTLVVSNFDFFQAFGGTGTDTLQTSGSFKLDLSLYAGTSLQDIERIDLSKSGFNILTLSQGAVHDISSTTDQLIIDGDKSDGVILDAAFIASGTQVVGTETYNVYKDGAGATVLLDQAIELNPTPLAGVLKLADLDGTNGFKLQGEHDYVQTGLGVTAAGDVNGDGFDDFIIGAGYSSAGSSYANSTAYVVFGGATGTNPVSLGTLNGNDGFALINPPPGQSSPAVIGPSMGAGDFNADGYQDFLVSSWTGYSYLVFGQPGPFGPTIDQSNLDGNNGFLMNFGRPEVRADTTAVADINGDGFDDVIVGSHPDSRVNVVLGQAGSTDAVMAPTFSITGPSNTGYSVDAGGDVNGDGIADLFIESLGAGSGKGGYVVFGHDDGTLWITDVSQLNGTNGFAIEGVLDRVSSIVSAGDVNGDGIDDVLVGASFNGYQYVVLGKTGGFDATVDAKSDGFVMQAAFSGAKFLGAAGDVNGDGYDDIIIGGRYDNGAGTAYLVYGTEGGFGGPLDLNMLDGFNGFKIEGVVAYDRAGTSVAGAGDVNGDGYDDLLITATEADPNGLTNAGESYIVYGGDFRGQVSYQGGSGNDTYAGTADAEIMIGGLGNDTLTGGGGTDVIRSGAGDDAIHVTDTAFREVDGGGGTDTLHLDFAGAIDLAAIRGKIEGVEVLDLDNGKSNAVSLHLADVLDLDVDNSDLGGVGSLDDVLKLDGNKGDGLTLFAADGWSAADTSSLAGYAVYTAGAVKIAVETDISVTTV
jgi:hypothetical protein